MELSELRKAITETDNKMAELFLKRMKISEEIARYKRANGLPIYDPEREKQNLLEGGKRVPPEYEPLYRKFLQMNMDLSKERQHQIMEEENA